MKVRFFLLFLAILLASGAPAPLQATPEGQVGPKTRCLVCGMFVAPYENWIVQVRLDDDRVFFFDGVKDMLVFYFSPGLYTDATSRKIKEIWVKDYYSLEWLEGRSALYVIGSDVYGPMGKEFIPFSSREAAENFMADHHGTDILSFDAITRELVESMRAGSRMRHGER
ncbi:MAG: nitrous oxide reductase accessory protein NosL [Desulfobulbaceae bacterium]